MVKFAFIVLVSFIFISCSSKKALENVGKNEFYVNALQYTSKCDILDKNNEIKAMFTVTRLNPIDKKWQNGNENFLIGIFLSNKREDPSQSVKILLNGFEQKTMTQAQQDYTTAKNIPFFNPWAKYYNLEFEPVKFKETKIEANTNTNENAKENIPNPNKLILDFNYLNFDNCSINFLKE